MRRQNLTLGFPEILFNLFPGMGAYSLLARRIALWVDAALRLGERELKMMSRLARAQARRLKIGQSPSPR